MSELSFDYKLEIPGSIPPSMNSKKSGYGAHYQVAARTKREWEGLIFVAILQAKVPKHLGRVKARCVLTVPTRHKRDEGNFRMVIEKALGDVLQIQDWLPDDTPEHYTFEGVTFEYEKGVTATTIYLEITD